MIRLLFLALIVLLPIGAAAQELTGSFGPNEARQKLTIRSTTDLEVMGPVVESYLFGRPDLRIDYEQWGSNDLYELTASDCKRDLAGAGIVISSAVHQMVRLVNDGCAKTYRSAMTAALPDQLRWRDQLWGISREPAVIVYNRKLVPAGEVPRSRFDLLDLLRPEDSRYRGRVATYDIETSGLGYLLAFADSLEASTFGGLMESFGRSGAVATCCSAEIIDAVIEGRFLLAYNVLGSYALARAQNENRLGVVAPKDYTLILSRGAMIPKNNRATGEASAFLEFLLSAAGRASLEEALLLVRLDEDEGALLESPDDTQTIQRPIALSPALLIALDRHKRGLFRERWRAAFPISP
ncbi:ABC transporter substrate-binding protein [Notoacmeibacter sp. MSK16QG-6]|uniref:ABC transporter substrate-binding protein n=1 Tax=Notoacmeibacter sp. MSK16QG-6 TaxID=2957982 RepID=UPI00209D4BC2|nr:ABC transporter substrate-binding protein [Notoacmeibacter sp. MSK16QG-6]MCP1199115.1 ABC transporter substrate-binding protein [Notoacmeibacter sp. MSK16QG-6]